jgi:hypothetical protein
LFDYNRPTLPSVSSSASMKAMYRKLAAMAALPLLLAAQDPAADAKRAQLLARIDADIAESYAAHEIAAPEIVESLQRVASRLGAGTRGAISAAYEAIPTDGRLFVPEELVRRVKDDDELAGMLAHALAHKARGPLVLDAPPKAGTIPLVFVAWPKPDGSLLPLGLQPALAEQERQADANAVEMLGRAGIDASGLLRYLERAKVKEDRLTALRTKIAAVTTVAATTPLTSECDVIQALLDEIAGKKPVPTLRR